MEKGMALKAELDALRPYNPAVSVGSLDDVLELFLSRILRADHVKKAEILLFNGQQDLVPVATAVSRKRPGGECEQHIRVEGYMLNSTVKHTSRRVKPPSVNPVFSIPLFASGGAKGFLALELSISGVTKRGLLRSFYDAGQQLATKINEIMLHEEIKELKSELDHLKSTNKELLQRTTSLSKELYAITALSTKVNQAMDFEKVLSKSMGKIMEVSKASAMAIYTRNIRSAGMGLSAFDVRDGISDPSPYKKVLRRMHKEVLEEIAVGGKPLVRSLGGPLGREDRRMAPPIRIKTLVGVPLNSKETTVGAMVLLYESGDRLTRNGIRLLSGMANIMGMAIENLNLYRRSERKKDQASFLVGSIAKFSEKLDLTETLRSVAEKAVELIQEDCLVYLLSETKVPFFRVSHQGGRPGGIVNAECAKRIVPESLDRFYDFVRSQKKSLLIKSLSRSRKMHAYGGDYFLEQGVHSLMAVPLELGGKAMGVLIVCGLRRGWTFDAHKLSSAEALANAAAVAVQNANAYTASLEMTDFLEKKIRERTTQIQRIQEKEEIRAEDRNDIVFRVNRRNRFVFVNKAMEALTGYSREELYRGDVRAEDVVAPEDRKKVRESFKNILAGKWPLVKDLEYRHLHRGGKKHIVSLTVYPETDLNGRITGLEGIGRDITDQRRLEEELEKTKDLAMLGEFSAAVAHQIRNPLGNILIGHKLLKKALGLDVTAAPGAGEKGAGGGDVMRDREALTKIFGDLSEGIYNLNQIITELLGYTRTLRLSPSYQRLDILLEETLGMFREMIKNNRIEVKTHFDPQLPSFCVDALLMGQVFQNTIHNAIQAMPRGGCLSVSAALSGKRPGYGIISIKDTGVGISREDVGKIFRPFYTTKETGTGLGLSVSYRIVDAHGGYIWASKNATGGLTIRILLPLDMPSGGRALSE